MAEAHAKPTHHEHAAPPLGHHPPADFPAPVRALAALSRALAFAEGVAIGVCLVSLIGLAVFDFLARNLRVNAGLKWVPASPDWLHGVIRHSVFLLGFIGAAYAAFTARHIRIDALTRMLKPRGRMVLRVVVTAGAIAICLVLARAAHEFLVVCREEAGEATQQGEVFTSARGAMLMIGGFLLVGFHFLVQVVLDLTWLISGREPPDWWIAEASHGEAPPTSPQEMMSPPAETAETSAATETAVPGGAK